MRYNDLWFRIIASLLAAQFIVMYGVPDSFFDLLFVPVYYEAIIGSFAIAFVLVNFVYWVTTKLDKKYDWQQRTLERAALQFAAGFVAPGLFAFFLAFAYFASVHTPILKTPYLRFDYPIILILLLLLNVYYLAYYFFLKWRMAENAVSDKHAVTGVLKEGENKQVFIVNQGARNIPVPIDDIAYFYRDRANVLRTFSGEDFVITQSLDDVQETINDQQFFRANRQLLVNREACKHFESLPYNKLQLFVEPAYRHDIIISQLKKKAFRQWLASANPMEL